MEPPRTVSYCDVGLGSQGGIVEKVDRRPESVQGAGPEADEKGHADEGEPGLMDVMDHEAHGSHEGGGGDQEAGQQLAETALVAAAAASQHHHAQPRTESREFTPAQLQQLESMYEHTQDPDWFTGRVISRRIGVTEAGLQGLEPEAEAAHAEEGELCLLNNVRQEGDINYEAKKEGDNVHEGDNVQEGDNGQEGDKGQEGDNGQEGNIGHEGDIGHEGNIGHEAHSNQEGGGGDQEPGQQQAAMALLPPAEGPQHEIPKPRIQRRKFTQVQVEELENMYKRNPYPDTITRRDLARRIGDTEARVKAWFQNRRAKFSRSQRLAMLRNAPPATLNHLRFKVLQKP